MNTKMHEHTNRGKREELERERGRGREGIVGK
jgi:hypothetical protein